MHVWREFDEENNWHILRIVLQTTEASTKAHTHIHTDIIVFNFHTPTHIYGRHTHICPRHHQYHQFCHISDDD